MSTSFTSANPSVKDRQTPSKQQRVFELPFGAQVVKDNEGNSQGVRFRLWAPDAKSVALVLNDDAPVTMPVQKDGWVELLVSQAKAGDSYRFLINEELKVLDPASRYQVDTVHGPSQVVDPAAFDWQDTDWRGRPWEEVVLYELHVGTFTPEGTYNALTEKLDYLRDLGITAIELMPIAQFPGERNWGYDGVLPFAPENRYGTPDDLKTLIKTAHAKGLMVFLDVVYNHFGPEGNYLHAFSKRFFTEKHQTPWGAAINFEAAPPVRDFFIQNALYWLNEFHFDGLRFDAVHAIQDDSTPHFLNELAEKIRSGVASDRHVHLVLENDDNQARFLGGGEAQSGSEAQTKKPALFNAQWNDDFHHAAHVALTGEASGYYEDYDAATSNKPALGHLARCLLSGFAYQQEPSPYRHNEIRGERSDQLPLNAFVNFLQNHDQIGNRAFGDRLSTHAEPQAMKAMLTALLLSPTIPLLFMGEEWQSKTPFQFFCDFGPELGPLVTEGRRKEFARFTEFSKPENQAKIPDPCQLSTFEASCLDWDDLNQTPFADTLAFTRHLLHTRQSTVVPLLKASRAAETTNPTKNQKSQKPFNLLQSENAIVIAWPLLQNETLVLGLNLDSDEVALNDDALKPLLDASKQNPESLIFESNAEAFASLQQGKLAPASAVYVKVTSWKQ
jgi:maltooligosyltrehalose trehalohydrolase